MPQLTLVEQTHAASPSLVPPLKWAGGKRWLVPALKGIWAPYQGSRLVEPFAGGLAVTLGLNPTRALLNDLNEHVVNFYRHLQAGLRAIINPTNSESVFYSHRNAFNELVRLGRAVGAHDDARRAAMYFYYLNRHCFNGLCRFNRSGEFNTPFGKYRNPKYEEDLTPYRAALANWEFKAGDFEGLDVGAKDFVYADPPYDDAFTSYQMDGFRWKDQERLASWLAGLRGPVVASNHATDRIVSLYAGHGFTIHVANAPRMINCTGDRTPVREMIATKGIPGHKASRKADCIGCEITSLGRSA